MEDIKKLINKIIMTIIVSSILFDKIEIDLILYSFTIVGVWIVLLLNYNIQKNLEIFDTFIIVSLGNLISYVLVNEVLYNGFINENITYNGILIYSIFLLILSIISFSFYSSEKRIFGENPRLMMKREKDLERLLYYIDIFEIVGINGRWGTGKSFLVNELKERIKDEYEIIEIDILSCNLNELQLILIKEIEKVMYKNRMISKYSNKLKSFLSDETTMSKLKDLIFTENNSYSEVIKGFQNELSKIDKKIIIIYEDIDRIADESIIKSIFGISEKLSNQRIKIIYQYYEDNLKNLGFTVEYLEKYIPFKMNLTEINFFEILNFVFKENDFKKGLLEIKDFDFLKEYNQNYRYNILYDEFGINKQINLIVSNVSIRKVENFLAELSNILVKDQYQQHKEIIISFFFLKHFIPSVYEKLNIETDLLGTIKFKINSKLYTIIELIRMYKIGDLSQDEIENIFNDEENQMNYCVLKLFNYNNTQIIHEDDYQKRLQSIFEEPLKTLKDRISNEKKDRLIWSLLANGKSEYTDYEYVGNKFIKDVLIKSTSEQADAYRQFCESLFYQDVKELDNETIFKMGVPSFIELFKSFRILDVTDDQQIGLVHIYFQLENIQDIDHEFIQTINYCSLKTNKEYIYILGRINKLNVVGNLNSEKCFVSFLKKFIGALSKLGYINTIDYYNINSSEDIEEYKSFIIKDLEKIIKDINKLRNKILSNLEFKEVEDELDTIIKFAKKLMEIIDSESKVTKKKYDAVTSKFSSRFANQEEFDRLKELAAESNDIGEEIRRSYLAGKITVYEIDKLLEELDKMGKGTGVLSKQN